MGTKKIPEGKLGTSDSREEFIAYGESGTYAGKDVEGNTVMVELTQGDGLVITTFQSNGWMRWDEYDTSGENVGTGFDGRWEKGDLPSEQ